MATVLRALLWVVVSLLVVVLLAALLLRWFDWNLLKDEVAALLSERLGTEVEIRGDLDVDVGVDAIRVQAGGIRVEDTLPEARPFLTLEQIDIGIKTVPLLSGNAVLDHLILTEPRVRLVRNENGEVNWDFKDPPEAEPGALPVAEHVEVRGGAVIYQDDALDAPIEVSIDRIEGEATRAGVLTAAGSARIDSENLRLQAEAKRLEDRENWRVDAALAAADARLSVAGTTAEPDLRVELSVPEPRRFSFLPVAGISELNAIRLTTRLTRDQGHWWFDDLRLAVGEQRVNGDVRIDPDQRPPMIYATLYLNRLELPEREERKRAELIPSVPIKTVPLHQLNLRANLRIGTVTNTPVPIEDIHMLAELYGGRLVLSPLSAAIAQGRVEGSLVFDASQQTPVSTVRLVLHDLDLAAAVPGNDRPVTGGVSGRIDLRTRGDNVEELAGNVDGQLLFVIREGAVRASWVEALDLDLAELLLAGAAEAKTPIRCGFIAFDAQDGVLRPRPVVLDTRDSLIMMEGVINLVGETLSLTLRAFPKDPSLLSARGPIRVTGSLANPSVDVLTPSVVGRSAAALALGALFGPVAGLIPLVEPGLTRDRNCRYLLADTPPSGAAGANSGAR